MAEDKPYLEAAPSSAVQAYMLAQAQNPAGVQNPAGLPTAGLSQAGLPIAGVSNPSAENMPVHVHAVPTVIEQLYAEAEANYKRLHSNPLYIFAVRLAGKRGQLKVDDVISFTNEGFKELVERRTPSKDPADIRLALRLSISEAKHLLLTPPARISLEAAHAVFERALPSISLEFILSHDKYNEMAATYAACHWSLIDQRQGSSRGYSKKTTRSELKDELDIAKATILRIVNRGTKGAPLLGPDESAGINLL